MRGALLQSWGARGREVENGVKETILQSGGVTSTLLDNWGVRGTKLQTGAARGRELENAGVRGTVLQSGGAMSR